MADKHIITGVAASLPIDNLDTDQIMPKQFLRIVDKAGLSAGVLYDLRFDADGRPKSDFVLNRPAFRHSTILIGGDNFGCGSSREHAVWGLQQLGIEAVIAPGFGEIFFGNALNNRLLPIVLPAEGIAALLADLAQAGHRLTIDLDAMTVAGASCTLPFSLGERHRKMIVEGLDMVGASLHMLPAILAFDAAHAVRFPWADAMR